MTENPDELLHRAAARPPGEPDVDGLRARAGRRRRIRRAGTALTVAAVLGVGSAAAVTLSGPTDDQIALQEPPGPQGTTPEPTPSPRDSATDDLTPDVDDQVGSDPDPGTDDSDGDPDADDQPAFDGDTQPYEREAAADQDMAVLSQVRLGVQDGYDRLVWEFAEGDRPRIRVEYVDEPRQPGSGNRVDVAGSAYLRLIAEFATDRGAELYAPDAQPYDGPSRIDGGNAQAVQEVVALGDFEANMQWAVGVDGQRPFRVRVLEDPLRIVVDIAHP